ncbi:MAG: gliding motility lipoprotein GldH [Chitinophagales bacterium]
MKKHILVLIISIFFFSMCEQKHFYNEYKSVNAKDWQPTDTLSFPVIIDEQNKTFQYSISIRHEKEYEFSNIWLKVIVKGNKVDTSFRYEIPLFKSDGKPYGKSSGSLCTQTVPLNTNLPLSAKGKYEIKIVQLMRKEPLAGITDVGVIIDKK